MIQACSRMFLSVLEKKTSKAICVLRNPLIIIHNVHEWSQTARFLGKFCMS